VHDIFWEESHYFQLLKQVGFKNIKSDTQLMTPKIEVFLSEHDIDTSLFVKERKISPMLWLIGYK